jgi:hypothetical protein
VHVLIWVLGLLWLSAGTARAEDTSEPLLSFVGCSELAQDAVRRIARIEVGTTAMDGADVEITCSPERIVLRARWRHHSADKVLLLSDVDESSRPRLVALAVAELLHELERLAALPPRPPSARPLPPAPEPEKFALRAGPALAWALEGELLGIGATLAGELRLDTWLALGLGLEACQGTRDISGGELRWRSFSGLASLRARLPLGPVAPFAELSVLGSFDELSGQAQASDREGASFQAGSAAGRLALGLEAFFAAHGVAALSAGLLRKSRALEARIEGSDTIEVGPWFASGRLELGARW